MVRLCVCVSKNRTIFPTVASLSSSDRWRKMVIDRAKVRFRALHQIPDDYYFRVIPIVTFILHIYKSVLVFYSLSTIKFQLV